MRPPTNFNNYTIQFAVVSPFYYRIGAENKGDRKNIDTQMEDAVSAAGLVQGAAWIGSRQSSAFKRTRTVRGQA